MSNYVCYISFFRNHWPKGGHPLMTSRIQEFCGDNLKISLRAKKKLTRVSLTGALDNETLWPDSLTGETCYPVVLVHRPKPSEKKCAVSLSSQNRRITSMGLVNRQKRSDKEYTVVLVTPRTPSPVNETPVCLGEGGRGVKIACVIYGQST